MSKDKNPKTKTEAIKKSTSETTIPRKNVKKIETQKSAAAKKSAATKSQAKPKGSPKVKINVEDLIDDFVDREQIAQLVKKVDDVVAQEKIEPVLEQVSVVVDEISDNVKKKISFFRKIFKKFS